MHITVIPARMAASRLPGKPLADIHGRPMIAWMAAIALEAGQGPVLVAAAEPEIAEAARAAGAHAVLTDPSLPSGSDRVAAALEAFDPEQRFTRVTNLQGDMPTIPAAMIALGARLLEEDPACDIATLASPSSAPAERDSPNVVKAIVSLGPGAASGRALYFTRAPAPSGDGPILRHVGLYCYRRAALKRFVAAPPSPLEMREKLEQLRALELGMTIQVGLVEDFPKGVDAPEDLARAREALA